jgi:hypothetical protein
MASSSSHNNNCISLSTLLEWYKIRDTFFGHNFVSQNIPLALDLVASCQHPDARWLTEACAGKDVTQRRRETSFFCSWPKRRSRAVFLVAFWRPRRFDSLRRSAELGFAFAQAWMAGRTRGEEKFKFAQLAAAQGERDGFFGLDGVFVMVKAVKRTWTRQRKIFCLRANLVMFRR